LGVLGDLYHTINTHLSAPHHFIDYISPSKGNIATNLATNYSIRYAFVCTALY